MTFQDKNWDEKPGIIYANICATIKRRRHWGIKVCSYKFSLVLYCQISALRSHFIISMTILTAFLKKKLHKSSLWCQTPAAGICTVVVNNTYCKTTVKRHVSPCLNKIPVLSQTPPASPNETWWCILKSAKSQVPRSVCIFLHIWLINHLISNFLSSLWGSTIGTWSEIRWVAK